MWLKGGGHCGCGCGGVNTYTSNLYLVYKWMPINTDTKAKFLPCLSRIIEVYDRMKILKNENKT